MASALILLATCYSHFHSKPYVKIAGVDTETKGRILGCIQKLRAEYWVCFFKRRVGYRK